MTEPTDTLASAKPPPRATVMKRYKRLQLRGFTIIAWLLIVAMVALGVLSETYLNTLNLPRPHAKEGWNARLDAVFLQAAIKLMHACGMSMSAIRVTMVVIVLISLCGIAAVVVHLMRAAPPKAQRLRKKEAIAQ